MQVVDGRAAGGIGLDILNASFYPLDNLEATPRLRRLVGIDRGSRYIKRCVFHIGTIESIASRRWYILGIASDGGQASAMIERTISYARHTIGDGDGGQASARVFAKYCIPIRCTYKGRKMILVVS